MVLTGERGVVVPDCVLLLNIVVLVPDALLDDVVPSALPASRLRWGGEGGEGEGEGEAREGGGERGRGENEEEEGEEVPMVPDRPPQPL